MLRACVALRQAMGLALHVMHLDHQLREESAADAAWVASLCQRFDVPFTIARPDGDLRAAGVGMEEAARDARYAAFIRTAQATGSALILVAHTADDQAETVLHHIVRGTGLRGLAGIPETRLLCEGVTLWRPLLTAKRSELRDYLASLPQEFRVDQTNDDVKLTRNRLRHEVLPLLEREFNPRVVEALTRLAQQASETHQWLAAEAQAALAMALIDRQPDQVRLDRKALNILPPILLRECFVQIWSEQKWPRQGMTAAHWQMLCEMIPDAGSASSDLPGGITVRRRAAMLVLSGRPSHQVALT